MTNETTSEAPESGSSPEAPPGRRLVRPADGKVIAGVAAGLADYWDLPVWLTRVIFIILAFFGGLGIALYAAAWILIPGEDTSDSLAESWARRLRDGQAWLGAGLIAIAILVVFSSSRFLSGAFAWAAALMVLGVLLYRGTFSQRNGTVPEKNEGQAPPGSGDDMAPASGKGAEMNESELGGTDTPPPPARPVRKPRPPRPRPARSILGRLAIATALIVVGVMALLDAGDVIFPQAHHYVAALLGVVGLGLLLGAWWGRARWLIAIGILALPILLATTFLDVNFGGRIDFRGEVGTFAYRPESAAELQADYRVSAGDLTLDLRKLDLDGPAKIEASVVFGELTVLVPDGLALEVDARAAFGEIEDPLGRQTSGVGVDRHFEVEGTEGPITLDLSVFAGKIEIRRVSVTGFGVLQPTVEGSL